jgi:hypothetical protein
MNSDRPTALARPGPESRFALVPEPAVHFLWTVETELERLKNRLLREALAATATPALVPALRRAANEAAAVSWLEPYPLLVFPVLFEEKARAARRQAYRQNLVRSRSADLLAEAA